MFKFVIASAALALIAAPALAEPVEPTGKVVTVIVDNTSFCGFGRYQTAQREASERNVRRIMREQKALGNTVKLVYASQREATRAVVINGQPAVIGEPSC